MCAAWRAKPSGVRQVCQGPDYRLRISTWRARRGGARRMRVGRDGCVKSKPLRLSFFPRIRGERDQAKYRMGPYEIVSDGLFCGHVRVVVAERCAEICGDNKSSSEKFQGARVRQGFGTIDGLLATQSP